MARGDKAIDAKRLMASAWVVVAILGMILFGIGLFSPVFMVAALVAIVCAALLQYASSAMHAELQHAREAVVELAEARHDFADAERRLHKMRVRLGLAQSKAGYFESVMQSSPDPLFTTDRDHLLMKFNQAATELLGHTQDEILGQPIATLFHDPTELQRLLSKVHAKGSASTMDIRALTSSGRIVHLNLSVAVMDPKLYGGSFTGYVFHAHDISRRKTMERELRGRASELEKLSQTDSLTGLFNQRRFHEDIIRLLDSCRENPGKMLTIMLMDLDGFKQWNAVHGHQAGDLALQQFAQAMELSLRNEIDSAYRHDNDEFIALLPDADSKQASKVAERLIVQWANKRDPENPVTVSIGIATYDGMQSFDEFFAHADAQLRRCQSEGGNGFRV